MTSNTGLKNNYIATAKVSASDLNRRANLLDTQTYGAISALGLGVIDLDNEGEPLKVTLVGGNIYRVAAGTAFILTAGDGGLREHPAFGRLSTATNVVASAEAPYIHIQHRVATDESDADSEEGTIDVRVIASEDEEVAGAELLAFVDGGTLVDRRRFIEVVALRQLIEALTLRIEALEAATEGGGEGGGTSVAWLSQLLYNIDHPVQADEYIDAQFDEIRGELAQLQGGAKKFPEQSDLIMDLTAALAVGLFEVNPPAVLRTQMSALGRGFGKGQNSTPDFSPDTGNPKQAQYDFTTGLIKP